MRTHEEQKEIYRTIIRRAFGTNYLVKEEGNYDDVWCGWDISPEPGVLIRFQMPFDYKQGSEFYIRIEVFQINAFRGTLLNRQIFAGDIPADKDRLPDYSFITQILKNYKKFC